MDKSITGFIQQQPGDRQALLTAIHNIIVDNDKTIAPAIETMMRQEMILYKDRGMMKYGLANGKQHLSLHLLPIYGSPELHSKYKALLPAATFQKGCINFSTADQVPSPILKKLIQDCAKIDLHAIREKQLADKKAAKKKK